MAFDATYAWMQRIITTLLEFAILAIFSTYLVHYHRYLQAMNRLSQKHHSFKPGEQTIMRWRLMSHIFTMITLATYCVQGLLYCFNAWSLYNTDQACNIYEKFSVWLYHVGKFSLYMVLVLRIRVVFHGSAFHRFVKRMLRIMYVFLFIFMVGATLGDFLTVNARSANIDGKMAYCILENLPIWGIVSFISADSIISLLCLILFNYPLKKLLKQCDIEDMEIMQITKKYAILTTIAIVSTFTCIFVIYITKFGWLSLLDNVINSMCLLFMSAFYSKYYDLLCGCCMKIEFEKMSELTQRSKTLTGTMRSAAAQWTDSHFGGGFDNENEQEAEQNNGHFSGSEVHRLRLGTPLPEVDERETETEREREERAARRETDAERATRGRVTSIEDAFAMVRSISPPTKMSNTLQIPYGSNAGSVSPVKNAILEAETGSVQHNVLSDSEQHTEDAYADSDGHIEQEEAADNDNIDAEQNDEITQMVDMEERKNKAKKLAMHHSVNTESENVVMHQAHYEEEEEEEEVAKQTKHVDQDTDARPKGLMPVNSSSEDETHTFEP